MEALQFDPSTAVVTHTQKNIPDITKPDEVLVKVAYAGVCGTDLHIIQGEFPCCEQPFTLGHEISGVVHQIGEKVTHVKIGDKVAVDPQNWCTTCKFCTTGRYTLCEFGGVSHATGIRYNGGWAQYVLVLARQVYKLPKSLPLKQGVLCEPISCIVRGMERCSLKPPGFQSILVIGAGIIGNLWCAILHHMGHRDVTVVEKQLDRINLNKKMETGFTCYTPEELRNAVEKQVRRWDLVIDCSGNGRAIEEAVKAIQTGGTLLVFGVASPATKISISPYELFKSELIIAGSNINPFCFPRAVSLAETMGDRYLNYKNLGIAEYQLKDHSKGISSLHNLSSSKVMFVVDAKLDN